MQKQNDIKQDDIKQLSAEGKIKAHKISSKVGAGVGGVVGGSVAGYVAATTAVAGTAAGGVAAVGATSAAATTAVAGTAAGGVAVAEIATVAALAVPGVGIVVGAVVAGAALSGAIGFLLGPRVYNLYRYEHADEVYDRNGVGKAGSQAEHDRRMQDAAEEIKDYVQGEAVASGIIGGFVGGVIGGAAAGYGVPAVVKVAQDSQLAAKAVQTCKDLTSGAMDKVGKIGQNALNASERFAETAIEHPSETSAIIGTTATSGILTYAAYKHFGARDPGGGDIPDHHEVPLAGQYHSAAHEG
ncbi:MAG: hypothetical protein SFT93_00370 [Rickettsiaceae bacterium]|nr:hypothetical protein [Rickettsiaceae bacterium]